MDTGDRQTTLKPVLKFPILRVVLHLLNEDGIQEIGVLSILAFCFFLEEYERATDLVHFTFIATTFIVTTESDTQTHKKLLH